MILLTLRIRACEMRYSEFKNEANNIIIIKRTFQKTLLALKARHKKRLKLYKERIRIAKQDRENKHLQSLRNTPK